MQFPVTPGCPGREMVPECRNPARLLFFDNDPLGIVDDHLVKEIFDYRVIESGDLVLLQVNISDTIEGSFFFVIKIMTGIRGITAMDSCRFRQGIYHITLGKLIDGG